MFDFVVSVEAFADHLLAVVGDDATNERPRTDESSSLRGELKRALHHASIEIDGLESGVWRQSDVIVPRRRELCQAELRSQISNLKSQTASRVYAPVYLRSD